MTASLKEALSAAIARYNERRRYPRYPKERRASYKIFSLGPAPELGRTREIGADGMCLITQHPLPKHSPLTIEIDVPDFVPLVLAVGKVLRSKHCGNGAFENEVKFMWLGQKERPAVESESIDSLVESLTPSRQSIFDD